MQAHPYADLFPMMTDDELKALTADIAANGQHEPIRLLGGLILDGRNRYRACERLGIEPKTEDLPADTDPVRYVLSLNLHRRHLDPTQRAMIAAKAANMTWGGDRGNQYTGGKRSIERLPGSPPITTEEAAEAADVSAAQVRRARTVQANAPPEVCEMVTRSELSLNAAAQVARLPQEERQQFAGMDADEVKEELARRRRKSRQPDEEEEPGPEPEPEPDAQDARAKPKVLGVGIIHANDAINCLSRIPKNDALREAGFKRVKDWIRRELKGAKCRRSARST